MSTNVFELPAHDADGRDLSDADWARLERNAAEIFTALGLDLETPGTRDTPRRFVRALYDATAGYDGDPKLRTLFPAERPEGVDGLHAQIVEGADRVLRALRAPCAAVPRTRSRRLRRRRRDRRHLEAHAARAPLRAALHRAGAAAEEIADGLQQLAGARGVAVRLEAAHLCTAMRGVEEDGSRHGHDRLARSLRRGRDAALRVSYADAVISPFSVLAEDEDLPRWDVPDAARRALRRRDRPRRAVRRRELRRVARRRRRRAEAAALARRDRGRERGGPVRARARARVRRRRRRRVGHAARLAEGDVAGRSRVSAGGRCARRAASRRGRPEQPLVVVVTTGASLDPAHPVLEAGALVLTTEEAASSLRASVPGAAEVVAVNDGETVDLARALGRAARPRLLGRSSPRPARRCSARSSPRGSWTSSS